MLRSRAQEPCSNCSKTDALFAQNLLTKHSCDIIGHGALLRRMWRAATVGGTTIVARPTELRQGEGPMFSSYRLLLSLVDFGLADSLLLKFWSWGCAHNPGDLVISGDGYDLPSRSCK